MLFCIYLSQTFISFVLFQSNQIGSIAVQRRIFVGVLHKVEQSSAERLKSPGWTPLCFDDIEADLSGHEVDVGVKYFCFEVHFRRHDRVLGRETDFY